jgi:hypothetical protein
VNVASYCCLPLGLAIAERVPLPPITPRSRCPQVDPLTTIRLRPGVCVLDQMRSVPLVGVGYNIVDLVSVDTFYVPYCCEFPNVSPRARDTAES